MDILCLFVKTLSIEEGQSTKLVKDLICLIILNTEYCTVCIQKYKHRNVRKFHGQLQNDFQSCLLKIVEAQYHGRWDVYMNSDSY